MRHRQAPYTVAVADGSMPLTVKRSFPHPGAVCAIVYTHLRGFAAPVHAATRRGRDLLL